MKQQYSAAQPRQAGARRHWFWPLGVVADTEASRRHDVVAIDGFTVTEWLETREEHDPWVMPVDVALD